MYNETMIIIVGLGNPGDEYCNTRHNIGWIVLEAFIEVHGLPSLTSSKLFASKLSEGVIGGTDVSVLLPTTYMNNSGGPVAKYVKTHAEHVLVVVHDDVDLAYGDVKVSYDRGAGGHNGVRSIISSYGSPKFIRVRIGIAKTGFFGGIKRPKGDGLSNFVLGTFTKKEEEELSDISARVDIALQHIIKEGVAYAMQEVNGK